MLNYNFIYVLFDLFNLIICVLFLFPFTTSFTYTSEKTETIDVTELDLTSYFSESSNSTITLKYVIFMLYSFYYILPSCCKIFPIIMKQYLISTRIQLLTCIVCGMSYLLNYHNSMLTVFSSSSLQNVALHTGAQSSYLSTNCLMTPFSELTKRLLSNSYIACNIQQSAYRSTTTEEAWQKIKVNPLMRYFKTLKWTPIPLGIGFALIAYQQFRHVKKRESNNIASASEPSDLLAPNLYVSVYTMLPLRAASRVWGWVNHIDLPLPVRKPLLNLFITKFGCNLEEAVVEDINSYRSLGEFFSRQLKKEVRPVYPGDCLVSPSDGQVLHFGTVENGLIEQVKGITYSLKSFLGMDSSKGDSKLPDEEYQRNLLHHSDNVLYHCVIYLAPGDYHKFHSPAQWDVSKRRHFHGELFSVAPGIVSWIAGLFNINERVVYFGKWKHGFFSLTAVGATNVGSIRVFFDDTLKTNRKKCVKGTFEERYFDPPVTLTEKGQAFGEFNLGSTIVLIFEAPKNVKFNVNKGQKIKYGELLSLCNISEVPS